MSSTVLFAFTEADRWSAGIGDPTLMGWVTVFAYAVAGLLCLAVAGGSLQSGGRYQALFWAILAVFCLALGLNKQLDLQTWFTLTMKRVALAQGWYEHRRPVQFGFILFVGAAAAGGFAFLWRLARESKAELWLPLFGFSFLACFVVVRAASFHHVDQFLKFDIGGVRMNWLFELGGIALVTAGALLPLWRARSKRLRQGIIQNSLTRA